MTEPMTDFGWIMLGFAVFIVLCMLLGLIKLASMATLWLEERAARVKTLQDAARVITSSTRDERPINTPLSTPATITTTPASPIAPPQNDRNDLLLSAKAEALAALVLAGKVGETEGIKIVYGVAPSSSNPRYLAARAALKAELEKQAPPKFQALTEEQEEFRRSMGLPLH